jgi:hypothetical protein
MTKLVDDALGIAGEGWPVFPCDSGKKPTCRRGFLAASREAREIRRLFTLPGTAMIGVPTGPASGFDVVDVDPRHEGNAWIEACGWKVQTRTHRTRSGGVHFLFRHAEGMRNSAGRIAPGVDVRGAGGYVIVPPSPGYELLEPAELEPWPAWLLEAAAAKPRSPRPTCGLRPQPVSSKRLDAFVQSILDRVRDAPDGEKHDRLRKAGFVLGGIAHQTGFSDAHAAELLLDALPDSCADWDGAERTALWALGEGRKAPIQLEDRARRPGR